jgi:hypothetical protein
MKKPYEKPVEYWDGLKTKEDLYNEFNADYEAGGGSRTVLESDFNHNSLMKPYYEDNEFKEVAQKLRKAAAPLLPVLRDILKHLPENDNKQYSLEELAKARIVSKLGATDRNTMNLYIATLLLALEKDLPERIESGLNVPEDRAARRAYKRFMAYKEKEAAKRAEFEKTQEFRTQRIEVALGIRDAIEYPEY